MRLGKKTDPGKKDPGPQLFKVEEETSAPCARRTPCRCGTHCLLLGPCGPKASAPCFLLPCSSGDDPRMRGYIQHWAEEYHFYCAPLGDALRVARKAPRSFSTLSLPGLSMITVYDQRRGCQRGAFPAGGSGAGVRGPGSLLRTLRGGHEASKRCVKFRS